MNPRLYFRQFNAERAMIDTDQTVEQILDLEGQKNTSEANFDFDENIPISSELNLNEPGFR